MKRINKAYVVEKASKKLFIGGGQRMETLNLPVLRSKQKERQALC